MMRRVWLVCLSIFAVVSGFTGGACNSNRSGDDEGDGPTVQPLVSVKTAMVKKTDMDLLVSATGRTEALKTTKIFSPIAGTVTSLNVLEGLRSKKGDVLLTIQTRESRAAIIGAQELVHSATTSEEREEALRALNLAEKSQNRVNVYGPFDGIVAAVNVAEGELVAENTDMLTYLDPSTTVFIADVSLGDVSRIKIGQRCFVRFPGSPGKRFNALLDAISAQSDAQTQTVRSRLRFDGAKSAIPDLKTDMQGTAQIITGFHKGVLVVPKRALLRDDETETYSLVIVTDDSLARSLITEVGASTDSTVEVRAVGLKEGMKVVVDGNYALADSTKVRATEYR